MYKKELNTEQRGLIAKTLDWAYAKAVTGFTGVDSAYELADSYLKEQGSLNQKVDSLIKWQVAKAATSGFTLGLGGLITMPLAVPANIASVIYMQIRMISAIAYMGGYDIRSDQVKSMVYICMAGNGAKELLKNAGIQLGEKLIMKLSTKLASKLSEKGIVSLGKAVPVLGGVVGGSFDAISTRIVGKVAKKVFITKEMEDMNSVEIVDSENFK